MMAKGVTRFLDVTELARVRANRLKSPNSDAFGDHRKTQVPDNLVARVPLALPVVNPVKHAALTEPVAHREDVPSG